MNHSEPAKLEDHIGYWLRRASNQVSAEFARRLRGHEVSVAEWVALRILFERDAYSHGELATEMRITLGAVTKIAAKLVAKGYLRCEPNELDRRGVKFHLTERGKAIVPILAREADDNDNGFFSVLTGPQQSQLATILRQLCAAHDITDIPTT